MIGNFTIQTSLFLGQSRQSLLLMRLATQQLLTKKTPDAVTRNRTVAILLFSGGYYRCQGEIRYWAVAWNAGGRSDLGLDNFQHREHTDAGQSPGASLWSLLCMWSRVISRKAVQTDLSPCLSVRWPVYRMLCIPAVGFSRNSHQVPPHIVHLKQEELNGTWR